MAYPLALQARPHEEAGSVERFNHGHRAGRRMSGGVGGVQADASKPLRGCTAMKETARMPLNEQPIAQARGHPAGNDTARTPFEQITQV